MLKTTMPKRKIEGHVYLYKAGMTVFWEGRPYMIEHNVIRNGELLVKVQGFSDVFPASHIKVDPTYYCIQTNIDDPD